MRRKRNYTRNYKKPRKIIFPFFSSIHSTVNSRSYRNVYTIQNPEHLTSHVIQMCMYKSVFALKDGSKLSVSPIVAFFFVDKNQNRRSRLTLR